MLCIFDIKKYELTSFRILDNLSFTVERDRSAPKALQIKAVGA